MSQLDMIESIVNTRLKYGISSDIKAKYKDINFTTETSTNPPKFPNIYTQELEPVEIGNSLANNKVNGVRSTIQLTVTTNTSKKDSKEVAYACVDVLKECRYNIVGMPNYRKLNDVHTYIIRARRNICVGDTI